MFAVFLISCFTTPDRTVCNSTPVPNAEVCKTLLKATDKLANERQNPGGVNYYPAHRCVSIRYK